MDGLTALLSSDIWVRWRLLANSKGLVTLLGPGETMRAEGRVIDLERPPIEPSGSKLGMVAAAVFRHFGDQLIRGLSWDFREPGSGQMLFSVRPPSSRDAPNVFTVTAGEDTLIGTVSQYEHRLKGRELRSDSGTACTYVPIHPSWGGAPGLRRTEPAESSRATIVDGALVLATVFDDRDSDAVAEVVPRSGMIEAWDFGVAFASGTEAAARLLALVAAILDAKEQQLNLQRASDNRHPPQQAKSRPAPGTGRGSAIDAERARAHEHQNDRLNQLQDKARRAGKEELAERLEKRRRGS